MYSPGGSTLFNFVIIYSGSKLHTRAKSAVYDCLVDNFVFGIRASFPNPNVAPRASIP